MVRVLVVDDEVICTMMLSCALSEQGFDVRTASRGDEAIKVGSEFEPDVLVSDWKLGEKIDGIEVARTLQDARPELVAILFSGLPAEELRSKAQSLGVRLFQTLEKPCGIEEVASLIREATGQKRAAVASA